MATIACAALLVILLALAAIDLRLDIAADNTLVEQIAAGGEPRSTAGIATALGERRSSDFERRLLVLAGGGLLLFGIAFAAAWRFARRVEGPMEELRDSVDLLAGGNWATHIATPAGGYGADLAHALERLRLNLSDHAATGRALDIMLDSMNDAVFVTSPDGLIKRINVAATQLLGWSQMELLGRELAYVISDQDRTNFNIEQAANETLELTVRTQNGQIIPVSLSGSVIAADDPSFQGCIFVARNITERKRAERRIRYLARYDTLTKTPNRPGHSRLSPSSASSSRAAVRVDAAGGGALASASSNSRGSKPSLWILAPTFGHSSSRKCWRSSFINARRAPSVTNMPRPRRFSTSCSSTSCW